MASGVGFDQAHADTRQLLLRDAFAGVPIDHMPDLMAKHRRQLVLVGSDAQQAGVDADLAAGQRKGVRFRNGEGLGFPVQITPLRIELSDQRVDDALRVHRLGRHHAGFVIGFHLVEGGRAHGVELVVTNQQYLAPAVRRGGTAGEQKGEQDCEKQASVFHFDSRRSDFAQRDTCCGDCQT